MHIHCRNEHITLIVYNVYVSFACRQYAYVGDDIVYCSEVTMVHQMKLIRDAALWLCVGDGTCECEEHR